MTHLDAAGPVLAATAQPADAVVDDDWREPPVGRRHRVDLARVGRFFLGRPGLVLAVLLVVLVVLAAFWPGLFTSRDPLLGVPTDRFSGPSAQHWFGTDELGRDLFARVVHGAALSLKATIIAVAVAFVVGGLLGLVAGFVGRWVEDVIMRVVDVLLSIPALFMSLALVTALGYGTVKVALAVGIASVASFARVMRAEVLKVRQATYVEASRSIGARWYTVLGRHVLPNALGPVLVLATLDFGTSVLAVSSLSFLGYGASPPAPEWGTLISSGRNYLANAWWLTTLPGLTVAATVLATNRIARALDGEWATQR
ncbi:ABC transporter permease [Pseudofrankia inefficax]|uniref:Binding-protein-dependent transport systems inner membrane component n=1 Tax=Pseudofrankia inefficax (strain DSM 45817 / CECT 9037 / DDB 130130 / EuI1c) TaxID=298654 RepID=E3JCZ1_PSEI1|nr:ABC transporter permease [Pseudofrankia inefficax]ADP81130.1 binding-protein-dependent transport systems inner membrane component [Pseudofrankia inefficax]